MAARIAIGGIWHETNTFATRPTELDDFQAYQLAAGEHLIGRYTGTGTELGGMIEGAAAHGFDLVPTLFAGAVPGGTIARATLDALLDELCQRLEAGSPLDGVLLVLHGAAVAEGLADADAYVLARVRGVVGPDLPVAVAFDIHANLSAAMVEAADVLVGYDTYPHTDMAARGREAADLLARSLDTGVRPASAFRKLPLVTVPLRQATDEPPMRDVIARLHAIEARPGIASGSVAVGFPYSDVPRLGMAVLIHADDEVAADQAADELADAIWARRDEFQPELVPVDEAVAQAVGASAGPVVLVDAADNVGGGSAGDGTVVLDALLRAGARGAVVVIADPEAVRIADAAGEGGAFDGLIGGKADDVHGAPVRVRGRVRLLTEGRYRHAGSYMTGTETSMGRTAVVEADGVVIVLTTMRTMPFDAEQLRCVGIEPAAERIVVVKSAIAWRAAYGPIATRAVVVDTPGICAANLARFPYTRRPRPLYPLDPDADIGATPRV